MPLPYCFSSLYPATPYTRLLLKGTITCSRFDCVATFINPDTSSRCPSNSFLTATAITVASHFQDSPPSHCTSNPLALSAMPFVDCIQGQTLEGVDDHVPLIAPFTDADVCLVQTFLQRPFASSSNNTSVALERIAHAGLELYKLFPTNNLLHANITSYQSVPSVYLSPPSSASFQSSPGFADGSNFTTPLTSPLYTPESFPCSLPFGKSVAGFFSCGVSQAKDESVSVEVDEDVLGEEVSEVIIEESEVPVVTLDDGKVVYTVLDCIGHGGFGRVFAAQGFPHDASVDFPRQVAIKAISKSDVRSNQSYFDAVANERKILVAANGTDGDFLTKLLSCFQDEDNIYFVMVSALPSFHCQIVNLFLWV